MKLVEYGRENPDTVIFLHGGGLCWWNFRAQALLLRNKYHVVLPVLDGHSGSGRGFTSIEENARALISYIDGEYGGQVLAIGGLSLGGQVLVEMLSQRGDICRFALIESACVIPSGVVSGMVPAFVGMSYGLVNKRWFSKLQFHALHMKQEFYEDYYRDSCRIKKEDLAAFLKESTVYQIKPGLEKTAAAVKVVVGGREQKSMRDSGEMLLDKIPRGTLSVLPGYYHGELSLNHPEEYTAMLEQLIASGGQSAVE